MKRFVLLFVWLVVMAASVPAMAQDTCETAEWLTSGYSSGAISLGDELWFKVAGATGETWGLSHNGNQTYSHFSMEILSGDCAAPVVVAGPFTTNGDYTFSVPADDYYYIKIIGLQDTYNYQFSLDGNNSNCGTGLLLADGDIINSAFAYSTDSEWYSVSGNKGDKIRMDVIPRDGLHYPRTTITIKVAPSECGGSHQGTNGQYEGTHFTYTLPETGEYYVNVYPAYSSTPEEPGWYQLSVSTVAAGKIVPQIPGPQNCSETVTLTFNYESFETTPDMFLYNAVINVPEGLDFGLVTDLLPFGTVNNNFYPVSSGTNQMTITGSTVGNPTSPVSGPGTTGLFSIVFTATSSVVGDVTFESLTLRDPDNNPIEVVLNGTTVTYDCDAPLAVTNITAAPHHNKVEVNWSHDGTDVDHYEVFSGVWHDGANASVYPEYDDVAGNTTPTRPADYAAVLANPAEWFALDDASTPAMDQTWPNADDRGVYYYEVFAVDAAGNVSPAAAANDRATNYWLGDINASGDVGTYDITALGAAFGTTEAGGGAYLAIADVGPTDDWSRVGIPATDNAINFEDLMVSSMNFGVVSPTNKTQGKISAKATLAWAELGNNQYALHLVDGSGIKGIHLQAAVEEGSIHSVMAGSLLDEQSEMTFLRNIGSALDVSVAVTGVENGFTGNGALFIVSSNAPIDMSDLNIEVRGYDNSSTALTMEATSGVLTPRVFALEANYPNPFNPMTKISFSLPDAQDVRLSVYGIDGKLVTTLVNETRSAGLHEVLWMGQDDAGQTVASGLYFYRIDAGPYSQVRKMTLMK